MKLQKIIIISFTILFLCQFFAAAFAGDWKFQKKQSGVEVYLRSVPGSKYKEFKGIMYVNKAHLSSMVAAFDDTSSYIRWMHNCTEARLLKRFNMRERYTYTVTHAPWPATDRDVIVYSLLSQNPGNLTVTIAITGRPDYIAPVKNRVRIPHMQALWTFKPLRSDLVMIVYQTITDAGGWLPLRLMNLSMVDLPFYTMVKFRNIIREKRYANATFPVIKEPAYLRQGSALMK